MSFDWKSAVATVAPGLATVLAGGNPLAGAAVKMLAEKLLGSSSGDPVEDEAKVAGILANGVTPEVRIAIIAADKELRLAAMQIGLEERRIDADADKAVLQDVQDARKTHGENNDILALGVIILIAWALLTGGTLFALYQMLIGGIQVKDVGIVATVFTVLGSTVGYVSNVAQQVVGFYFGSSRGSQQKTVAMADAITAAGRK